MYYAREREGRRAAKKILSFTSCRLPVFDSAVLYKWHDERARELEFFLFAANESQHQLLSLISLTKIDLVLLTSGKGRPFSLFSSRERGGLASIDRTTTRASVCDDFNGFYPAPITTPIILGKPTDLTRSTSQSKAGSSEQLDVLSWRLAALRAGSPRGQDHTTHTLYRTGESQSSAAVRPSTHHHTSNVPCATTPFIRDALAYPAQTRRTENHTLYLLLATCYCKHPTVVLRGVFASLFFARLSSFLSASPTPGATLPYTKSATASLCETIPPTYLPTYLRRKLRKHFPSRTTRTQSPAKPSDPTNAPVSADLLLAARHVHFQQWLRLLSPLRVWEESAGQGSGA